MKELTEEKLQQLVSAAKECGLSQIVSGKSTPFGMSIQNYTATNFESGEIVYVENKTAGLGMIILIDGFQFLLV